MRSYSEKPCESCGAGFVPTGGGSRFCSTECRRTGATCSRRAVRARASRADAAKWRGCSVDGCANRTRVSDNATGMCSVHSDQAKNRACKEAAAAAGLCVNCRRDAATAGGRCDACRKHRRERAGATGINRTYLLRTKYGLTPEGWFRMFAAQGEKCAICATTEAGGKHGEWHTDHDHASGQVRGILCAKCNWLLGHANDDPETLLSAASYLNRASPAGSPALRLVGRGS